MIARIGWVLIVYGVCGAIGCLAWLVVAWALGSAPVPSLVAVETMFIVHSAALMVTFHRRFGLDPLPPLIAVTEWSVRLARLLLGSVLLTFALGVAYLFPRLPLPSQANEMAAFVFLDALVFVTMVYIVIHWALRPENVLWPSLVNFLASPIPFSIGAIRIRKLKTSRERRRG